MPRRPHKKPGAAPVAAPPGGRATTAEPRSLIADQLMRAGIALTVIAVPLSYYRQLFNLALVKDILFGGLVLLMGAMLALKIILRQPVTCPRAHLNLAVWALIAVALISGCLAQYHYAAVGALAGLAASAIFYLLVIIAVRTPEQAFVLLVSVAGGAAISSLCCILQRYHIGLVPSPAFAPRLEGLYGNPTFLASYLAILLPPMLNMALFPSKAGGRWWWRAFFTTVAALMIAALVLTGTVAAIIGLVLALTVNVVALVYVHYAGTRRMVAAVLLAAVCSLLALLLVAAAMPASLRARIRSIPRGGALSETYRLMVWRGAARIFLDRPVFGGGPGSFQVISRGKYFPFSVGGEKLEAAGATHAHNFLLESLAETGALGGAVLLWFIAAFFCAVWRVVGSSADRRWKHLTVGLAAGALAFLVQNLFAVTFFVPSCAMFLWLSAGLTVSALASTRPGAVRTVAVRGLAPRALIAALAVAAVVMAAPLMYRTLAADHLMAVGFVRAQRGDNTGAFEPLEGAVEINPYAMRAWYQLAVVQVFLGDIRSGAQSLERSAALSPDFMRTQFNLGGLYAALGQLSKAERCLLRAASYEQLPDTRIQLAKVLFLEKKRALARQNALQAAWDYPEDPGAQRGVAEILLALGDLRMAQHHLSIAAQMEPNNPQTLMLQARILWVEGRREEARRQARRVTEIAPGSPAAQDAGKLLALP